MAILQRIQSLSDQLAESEGKVAVTILADPHLLEHYTITSLAQHAGTSTSAVLRFCHSLGYAGFKDFRYELISEIRKGESASDTQGNDAFAEVIGGYVQAIRRLDDLDRSLLDTLVAQIVEASCVFCVGIHRSFLPAEKLRMNLEDLGILALSAGNTVQATHLANLVREDTCIIIFSESGSQTSYRPALDAGLVAQGYSGLVTSNAHPQLSAWAHQTIVLPSAGRTSSYVMDEHPVAMAFVELLSLVLNQRLQ